MNKEQYLEEIEGFKAERRALEKKIEDLKLQYIEDNKPCNIGDIVRITLSSGRKVQGEIVSYGILADSNVCITCYKEENKNKYITIPHIKVELVHELMKESPIV